MTTTFYNQGYSDGWSGGGNQNPYDQLEDYSSWCEYEDGFYDGSEDYAGEYHKDE